MKTVKSYSLSGISVMLLLMFNYTLAFGQSPTIGFKGGVNISNLYVEDVDDENAGFGFNAGIFAKLPVVDVFAIQPELLYTQKGATAVIDALDQEVEFSLNYLEIPVLAALDLGDFLNIHGGVYAAYLLNSNVEFEGTVSGLEEINEDNFNRLDYGLAAGVSLNFTTVGLGARYSYGLRGVGDGGFVQELVGVENAKNSVLQFFIKFALNKEE